MLTLGRPLLAVVDLDAEGDGIAYEGRLLRAALADLADGEVSVIALHQRGASPGSARRPLERARFAIDLARRQRRSIDWVAFNHIGLARAQALVPRAWRRPYAVVLNGVEAWDENMGQGRRRAVRAAALRLAISQHTAERAMATHPELGSIVPCPLGLLPRGPDPQSGDVDQAVVTRVRRPSAIVVGRMSAGERYKGHDELLDAWPTIARAVPGAQLVVVGRGDDLERLRSKATALGLGEQVLFTGFVSDATRLAVVRAGTAFVLPSRGEGFGFVYAEAMQESLPCLGCRGGAAAELIVDGRTGILVEPGTAADLVRGVTALLANPVLARQMGKEGRRRFEAEFAFERFRARLGAALAAAFTTEGQGTLTGER